jgi:hypothetical protein
MNFPSLNIIFMNNLTNSQQEIYDTCNELRDFLIEKNKSYGDSALNPVRIMSKSDPIEQIKVRIDDKLSRLSRGMAAGEDVEWDLFGYFALLRIARSRQTKENNVSNYSEA